jgi:membrane protein implicated in regulation of membrane protease activity
MSISSPYLWLIIALVFFVIEISVPSFGFVFAGFSAILAAIPAYFDARWEVQAVVFAVSLMAGLTLLRPRLLKRYEGRQGMPSRTDALMGRKGIVTQAIEHVQGSGRVLVEEQDWSARSKEFLAVGTPIEVIGADGIVLNVRKIGAV